MDSLKWSLHSHSAVQAQSFIHLKVIDPTISFTLIMENHSKEATSPSLLPVLRQQCVGLFMCWSFHNSQSVDLLFPASYVEAEQDFWLLTNFTQFVPILLPMLILNFPSHIKAIQQEPGTELSKKTITEELYFLQLPYILSLLAVHPRPAQQPLLRLHWGSITVLVTDTFVNIISILAEQSQWWNDTGSTCRDFLNYFSF